MLGIGIIIPIIPALFFEEGSAIMEMGVSESMRSVLYGFLLACYPAMQFFGAPILGALSDRHGRKPILTISLIGTCIGYVLFAIAIINQNLPLLFFSRMLPGFTGGNISVAMSSISDISDDKTKTQNFGLVMMAFGLGFIIGPALGGILGDDTVVSWFGHDTPFWFTAALTLFNVVLVQFIYKETLKKKSLTKISAWSGIRNITKSFRIPNLRSIFSVVLLLSLGFTFFTQFFSVYLIEEFQFSEKDIGLLFGWIGIWLSFTQGFVVRKLSHISSYHILKVAIPILAAGLILLLIPNQSWWLWIINPIIALAQGSLAPNLTTVVSRQASADRQGEILGINQSMQSLGHTIPPIVAGYLLAINIALPLVAAAAFTIIGWIVYLAYFGKKD